MSQFDRYTTTEFVECMRVFLGIKKQGFLKSYGFIDKGITPKRGRLMRYKSDAVESLTQLVNKKAERAEAMSTQLCERIHIARDYLGLSDADISKKMSVSRELVRLWRIGVHKPTDLTRLATVLNVTVGWLELGQQEELLANSHIGVRVGTEAFNFREHLYSLTLTAIDGFAESSDKELFQFQLENAVFKNKQMSVLARRAGGRWQFDGERLVFVPWLPVYKRGLTRRLWSDQVELIMETELSMKKTVYAAWKEIQKQCADLGLTPEMYPKKISIYKRLEKQRNIRENFGVDINSQIETSCKRYNMPN